ncbi:MAG: phospholipase D-like domain-containing protein [Syntrophobacterales bacterium]|jgi:phosphatidylserine/phosphatidylglycerophosphate/cardiolipin synthase-like enzyme
MVTTESEEIYFGGPDLPPGRLRDLLAERVAAVPAGGAIDWVTYYFRDRQLAEELLRAHRRGVKVTITLEGHPRTPDANDEVIAMLAGPDGLDKGFRTVKLPRVLTPSGKLRTPHLHLKLYCFSHPKPVAFIGSFNPSGNDPEERPDVLREIGDQDRGHNVLIGLHDPTLVNGLLNHARWLHRARHRVYYRFSPRANRTLAGLDTKIYFWPRILPHPAMRFLKQVGTGARIRIAASHLKGLGIIESIIELCRRDAAVEILAEPTVRRVPSEVERLLIEAGIPFQRVTHPEDLPMHNKFVLVEKANQRWVVFGSFNWTGRSYWLNYEIGAISANEQLFAAFAARWEALEAQVGLSCKLTDGVSSATDSTIHYSLRSIANWVPVPARRQCGTA